MMKKIAVFPGSFDPITFGHIDIVLRALPLFDRLVISVAKNPSKNSIFSVEDRVQLIKKTFKSYPKIQVDSFSGLLAHYLKKIKADAVIRGLRSIADAENEFQMAWTNQKLYKNFETIFLLASQEYSFLSSRLVREVASLGGDVSKFVPREVVYALKKKFQKI